MKENEMTNMLEKYCQKQIEPPEYLVAYTLQRINRHRFLDIIIFTSMLLNALVTIFIIAMLFLPGLSWGEKILFNFGVNLFFNGFLVLLLLNKGKIVTFFKEHNYLANIHI